MPTDIQLQNLAIHADFLATSPIANHFDMDTFQWSASDEMETNDDLSIYEAILTLESLHTCGTSACAIGWGPAAGFPISSEDNSWFDYGERVFGVSLESDEEAFDYLFGSEWVDIDNTPTGCAERIRTYLKSGVPHAN
jgi:hypothetical protein